MDGNVNYLNPAAEKMLRAAQQQSIGKPVGILFQMSGRDGLAIDPYAGLVCEALNEDRVVRMENQTFWRMDDTSFPAECVTTPIYLEKEQTGRERKLLGAMITFRDISDRQKVDRIKSEFISIVSHELRSPLTSIRGSLGLIASGKMVELPEKAQLLLETAVRNTDRLARLINDILDVERLETARPRLQQTATTTTELVRQAMDSVKMIAEEAGVFVRYQVDHLAAQVDPERVVQVLTNLVSNAIKFSESGAYVTVAAAQDVEAIRFSVTDTGRGIPPEKLDMIFDRFQQADSSDIRSKGGSGLGLTIARAIVRQHGGRIWVESTVGVGSTFTFVLPQRRKTDLTGHLPLGLS